MYSQQKGVWHNHNAAGQGKGIELFSRVGSGGRRGALARRLVEGSGGSAAAYSSSRALGSGEPANRGCWARAPAASGTQSSLLRTRRRRGAREGASAAGSRPCMRRAKEGHQVGEGGAAVGTFPIERRGSFFRGGRLCGICGCPLDKAAWPLQPATGDAVSPAALCGPFMRGGVAAQRDVPRRLQPDSYLDRWLRIAVKSGIKELRLSLSPFMKEKYCFPCWVLFDVAVASSIESLIISSCTFHPIGTLGCFRRLKSLGLRGVRTTEEGLRQLLSKSISLEWLEISSCNEIICLKIPCTLQKLKFLKVGRCRKVQVIEIGAPNLSAFHHYGFPPEIYIGDSSQLTEVYLQSLYPSGILSYGHAKLPSIASNVERLTLVSCGENVNTPMFPEKLHHLKSLEFELHGSGACSPVYDIFSLVSFLDASPALESFILRMGQSFIIPHCDAGDDDEYLRWKPAYQHDRLKRVMIAGFRSAKSLIKLVIHILESAPSLERLMLDTAPRRHGVGLGDTSICAASRKRGKCCWMSGGALEEADRAVEAAGRYILGRVPAAVEFELLEACGRCTS